MHKVNSADREDAPRPMPTYLVLAIVVLVVVVGAYINRDAITALATGSGTVGASGVSGATTDDWAVHDKSLSATCGQACWLYVDGQPPGDFATSRGKIGILDYSGMCRSVKNFVAPVDEKLCCRDTECPASMPFCRSGICTITQ